MLALLRLIRSFWGETLLDFCQNRDFEFVFFAGFHNEFKLPVESLPIVVVSSLKSRSIGLIVNWGSSTKGVFGALI